MKQEVFTWHEHESKLRFSEYLRELIEQNYHIDQAIFIVDSHVLYQRGIVIVTKNN